VPRLTITTTPQKVCEGLPAGSRRHRSLTRSFTIIPPSGSGGVDVLLERGGLDAAPSMDGAVRYPFGTLGLAYECEPGQALWAATASGTASLDVLQGGER
jgi:hypothetical protein